MLSFKLPAIHSFQTFSSNLQVSDVFSIVECGHSKVLSNHEHRIFFLLGSSFIQQSFLSYFCLLVRISPRSLGWPGTHYVDQAEPELKEAWDYPHTHHPHSAMFEIRLLFLTCLNLRSL